MAGGKGMLIQAKSIPEALLGMKTVPDCLAGGTYVLSSLFMEKPDSLLSLREIPELQGISDQGDLVRIGALVTFQEALESELLPGYAKEALSFMGSRTKRNMATVGGNTALWRGDSYLASMLLASGAKIETAMDLHGETVTETLPAGAFPGKREGRLITAICLKKGITGASRRYANTLQSHAELTVSMSLEDGIFTAAAAERTSGVFLMQELSERLSHGIPDEILIQEIRDFCSGLEAIQTDDRCSAEYKRYLLSTAIWDLYAALRGEAAS